MIWALLNDLAQRIITFDKYEQRKKLSMKIKSFGLAPGKKVLDFGCGTGLFAKVFDTIGLCYWGYDIDDRLITYASKLYKNCQFTTSKNVLHGEAPFDLILANCCFHHMDDDSLSVELDRIKSLLSDQGILLIIDLLLAENTDSFFHHAFMKLERGKNIRTMEQYQRKIQRHFFINRNHTEKSHFFSFRHQINPVYNELAVFVCKK